MPVGEQTVMSILQYI